MKKVEANRYPHAATLFKFCKQALEIKYEGNVKVIDQDVGAILGYDPADCSHWKKGKKNIRSLSTLRSIADHLNVDDRLLIDIASGRVGLEEAIYEYKGYGAFQIQGKSLETMRKEFYKNPTRWQNEGDLRSFEEIFDVNRPAITAFASKVSTRVNATQAPVHVPDVLKLFANVNIRINPDLENDHAIDATDTNLNVQIKTAELRPYLRF